MCSLQWLTKQALHSDSAADKVCEHNCSCSGSLVPTDMQGLKLDIAILESYVESDFSSLKSKQGDIGAIFRKQDNTIIKLYEDNMFYKSKLINLLLFCKVKS